MQRASIDNPQPSISIPLPDLEGFGDDEIIAGSLEAIKPSQSFSNSVSKLSNSINEVPKARNTHLSVNFAADTSFLKANQSSPKLDTAVACRTLTAPVPINARTLPRNEKHVREVMPGVILQRNLIETFSPPSSSYYAQSSPKPDAAVADRASTAPVPINARILPRNEKHAREVMPGGFLQRNLIEAFSPPSSSYYAQCFSPKTPSSLDRTTILPATPSGSSGVFSSLDRTTILPATPASLERAVAQKKIDFPSLQSDKEALPRSLHLSRECIKHIVKGAFVAGQKEIGGAHNKHAFKGLLAAAEGEILREIPYLDPCGVEIPSLSVIVYRLPQLNSATEFHDAAIKTVYDPERMPDQIFLDLGYRAFLASGEKRFAGHRALDGWVGQVNGLVWEGHYKRWDGQGQSFSAQNSRQQTFYLDGIPEASAEQSDASSSSKKTGTNEANTASTSSSQSGRWAKPEAEAGTNFTSSGWSDEESQARVACEVSLNVLSFQAKEQPLAVLSQSAELEYFPNINDSQDIYTFYPQCNEDMKSLVKIYENISKRQEF